MRKNVKGQVNLIWRTHRTLIRKPNKEDCHEMKIDIIIDRPSVNKALMSLLINYKYIISKIYKHLINKINININQLTSRIILNA